MRIYAVVPTYEDGVWIGEDDSEELLFATLELAEENKLRMDAEELADHEAREVKRLERWNRMNAATAILEANNFEGVQDAIPSANNPFYAYEYKSKTQIIVLEVKE